MVSHSVNEGLRKLRGLRHDEVVQLRAEHGHNDFTHNAHHSFLRELLRNFGDPIIKILLIALVVNIVIKLRDFEWYESAGIAVAILISTFVSTLSEYGSESAFEKLRDDALRTNCRVLRDEGVTQVPVVDVVVRDYVLLSAGERVPADGIIVSGELYLDQSPLNGETKESYKAPGDSRDGGFSDPAKLFRGSIVTSGDGIMLVKNVGAQTVYGKIAKDVAEPPRESPLKTRLAVLAGSVSKIGYCGAILVAIANLVNLIVIENGFDPQAILQALRSPGILTAHLITALTLAISVIVVAIPEGLPLMITVVLSSNMKRMLRDNVLVRKLVGIETSGSINILFTDKTGTLTTGNLRVAGLVTGAGEFIRGASDFKKTKLYELMELSAQYNTGAVLGTRDGKRTPIGGNATERALLEFTPGRRRKIKTTVTVPFSSRSKYSGVQISGERELTLLKGAPELILPVCTHYYDKAGTAQKFSAGGKLSAVTSGLAKDAYRLLALAASDAPLQGKGIGENLTLIGIVAIRDELRESAKQAVGKVCKAGIQVVMITGDNKNTAVAIAREAGLLSKNSDNAVITSDELAKMTDSQLKERMPELCVVARAVPSDKSRLVTAAQELGLVTGMTGDGINDAPALKKADVGFSMGSGTEVAKEASDIVILDDNFLSISKAILYGRTIFKSIRKFIIFQLTINFCAVGVSVIGPFIGIDSPITVLQMLWVNMVMDTLAGLAFAGEPPLEEYMSEPPKKRAEPIINSYMYNQILCTGTYITILCLAFLKIPAISAFYPEPRHFMTAFFAMFIFAGVFNSFSARTPRINLLANISRNKAFLFIMLLITLVQIAIIYRGGAIFRTAGLTPQGFRFALLIALTVIPFDLVRKLLISKHHRGNAL